MTFTDSVEEIVARNAGGLLAKHSSWARVPLGSVCAVINGFPFPSEGFNSSVGMPLIRIRDVVRGWTDTRFDGEYDQQFLVSRGDLLVGMDGDFNCSPWQGESGLLNQRVCKVVPREEYYSPRFVRYVLQGYLAAIHLHTPSMTVKHLSSRTLMEIPLPLPPRAEQERVADVLDEKLDDVGSAVGALERVQRNLKRCRAAVLQAAVEGRLVPTGAELARAEGRDYELASELLKRILTERRRRWEEAELARLKDGREALDEGWQGSYVPPEPLLQEVPQTLPEGWCWASVDQLGIVSGGVTKNPGRASLPVQLPYMRVANVYSNDLRLDEIERIGVTEAELRRVLLERGDLLVVEGNGSLDQIGRVAVWDGSVTPCVHQNHLIKVRFQDSSLSGWVLWWLLSPWGRQYVQRAASSTSGLHTLSLSKVRHLPVPLPPLDEQRRIQREAERLLSVATKSQDELRATEGRSARLRQSILKWAFEGRLVDQDPNDEPASVLLERIRQARTAEAGQGGTKAKRKARGAK